MLNWTAISLMVAIFTMASGTANAQERGALRGYLTTAPVASTLQILDDVIHISHRTVIEFDGVPGRKSLGPSDLVPGMLVEARGEWTAEHQLSARKIICDWSQSSRPLRGEAILQANPHEPLSNRQLRLDGEILSLDPGTKLDVQTNDLEATVTIERVVADDKIARRLVRYAGVRKPDGVIATTELEIGSRLPPDAFRLSSGLRVVRTHDPQAGFDVLEFRKETRTIIALKLFPVPQVQEYVSNLGYTLLPSCPDSQGCSSPAEFRFYVIENPEFNAVALPDGTVLVNTGLLASVQNESQLAFVLSHEIAHASQAHGWRRTHETRGKRVGVTIEAAATAYFSPALAIALEQVGLSAVINGFGRQLEAQADRIGLQNQVDHGYDPRESVTFFRLMIERYKNRSSSVIWSDHDSSLLRGSFLVTQVNRVYHGLDFSRLRKDTQAFQDMQRALGPTRTM